MKLTPWYPGNVKPVRVGVYERKYPSFFLPVFCKWNGDIWFCGSSDVEFANQDRIPTTLQSLPWRGIAKEQK